MNFITIHGRLTRDPETRNVGQTTVCNFAVADNQRYNREKTNYHECAAWGKQGEFVQKYFSKGQEIVVVGEYQQRDYEAKDGSKYKAASVRVDQVDFCGSAKDNRRSTRAQEAQPAEEILTELPLDEDLPF